MMSKLKFPSAPGLRLTRPIKNGGPDESSNFNKIEIIHHRNKEKKKLVIVTTK